MADAVTMFALVQGTMKKVKKQSNSRRAKEMQEKIDKIIESLEYLPESDPGTFSNPYCEDEKFYHAIAEAIKILKSVVT